ncbi:MAG TPA: D-aminoacylase [Solirubrobacteraceae bacterium]
MLDLKIEGGTVVDGTGTAGGRMDVGIQDEAIVSLGDLSRESAGRTLTASGKIVTPGFIDIHSHSDWALWANRRAESKIRQGVTTEVVGNCGFSPAPVATEYLDDMRGFAIARPRALDFRWRSVEEYLDRFDADGTALNVVQLIGHGALRIATMGFARRAPSGSELRAMETLLAAGMEAGAWGLSTGLIYAPGSFATTEEIVALARVAARHRGIYATHVRGEAATLLDAIAEAIRVGREADMPVQVSHVKAAGRPNWGRVGDALALIDAAVAEGLDVMADVYPYTASSTFLRTLLPAWALEGGIGAMKARLVDPDARARIRDELTETATGQSLADRVGWDNVMIASCSGRPDAERRRLSALAAARAAHPFDVLAELLEADEGQAHVIQFQLDERDVRRALVHPRTMIGSDGSSLAPYGELGQGHHHPRSYGTFPRVLGHYVREERLLSLPQAVHKMTGLPARRLGLRDRGVIRVGARADLVVLDPRTIADVASYEEPHRYPLGVEQVLVNGRYVIRDGQHTGSLPGKLLRNL